MCDERVCDVHVRMTDWLVGEGERERQEWEGKSKMEQGDVWI